MAGRPGRNGEARGCREEGTQKAEGQTDGPLKKPQAVRKREETIQLKARHVLLDFQSFPSSRGF